MKKLLLILVAAAATLFSAALRADDYPSRPITIVAVFGPGSASDTICRIIADKLSPLLGQPVIVEDRPGADGALAALYVHHQPADGYTLLMGTNSPLTHSYTGAWATTRLRTLCLSPGWEVSL
jgi:putative tricarboxylic transport membrane protein